MVEATNLQEAAERIVQHLGLPKGFLPKLLNEDDWSFVVKLESLIESACTYLLVKAINQQALEDIFSRLEIANKYTGKIAFIKALNLLEEEDLAFIHAMATLRNTLVHDVKNIASFSFSTYIEKLDNQQLTNLQKALLGKEFIKQSEESGKDRRQILKDSAKLLFLFGALACLGNIYIVKLRDDIRRESRQVLAEHIDRFGGPNVEIFQKLLKNSI